MPDVEICTCKPINVYVDGIFDLFHEGHITFLREASKYGRLIVGVHSDTFAKDYKRLPFMPERTRYEVVRACRFVDKVIEDVDVITNDFIDEFDIGLVFHGDDFSESELGRYYLPAMERGIFRCLPYTKHVSTTKLIESVQARIIAL